MSIIIPSKHIYAKDNQKVIDNLIDRIEVHAKEPQIIADTQNVYNGKVNIDEGVYNGYKKIDFQPRVGLEEMGGGFIEVAAVKVDPIYRKKTITVPKNLDNGKVIRLLTGKDKDDNTNIKYTIRGIIKTGIAHGSVTYIGGDTRFSDVSIQEPTSVVTKETIYSLPQKGTKIDYTYTPPSPSLNDPITASITFSDESTDRIISETANNIELELDIFSELYINKLRGKKDFSGSITGTNVPLEGEYEAYIPTQIEFSIYGDTISLDLKDKVVKIGSGNEVYSYSGNELIQTTNILPLEDVYGDIIKDWENGKENATIRCGIENYYLPERDIKVEVLSQPNAQQVIISTDEILKIGEKLKLYGQIVTVKNRSSDNTYLCLTSNNLPIPIGNTTASIKEQAISKKRENNLPMTFHIGDIVIPYAYGVDGKDKPLSLYKNGQPKEFEVLGKRMIYDGAIWQELTIQEITAISLNVIEKLTEINGKASIVVTLENGAIRIGDILKYEGEYATVNRRFHEQWELLCDINGKFYNAVGKTILVTRK